MAEEAVASEGEGYGLGRLQHKRVGAAVAAGGDYDLGGAVGGGGQCPHVLGSEVGHVGGQDEDFGCAVGRGVAGRLGQGGVELWFRLGVIGAAGRWGCARLTFFGQRMAVAADYEDLGVKMGLADGRQGAGEQFAVEGAPLPGRDMAGEAAFAFVEGLDGNDCPQTHFRAG